jgi:hypothetical protein
MGGKKGLQELLRVQDRQKLPHGKEVSTLKEHETEKYSVWEEN